MDMNKIRPASDAAWYCRKDAEEERFYEIFFQLCRKYSVRWASEYLADENYEKYAARVGDELIALAAYEVLPTALVVHIVYMEAQPESNPTLDGGIPKYRGIGRLLIAYGIKLSIDSGLTGDVVLEAKTTSLAKHYEEDFGAVLLPTLQSSAPRYLIADEAAKRIFFTYLD